MFVSVSADSSLDGHDLAVDALGHCVRDVVFAVAYDVVDSLFDCAGDLLHRLQFCVDDTAIPVFELACCCLSIWLRPQVSQHLLVSPRLAGLKLQVVGLVEKSLLLLAEIA